MFIRILVILQNDQFLLCVALIIELLIVLYNIFVIICIKCLITAIIRRLSSNLLLNFGPLFS